MTQNAINNSASELTVDNLFLDGNTLSSTDTNGNIILAPDGSGEVSVTAAPIVPSTDRLDSLGSSTNSWNNVFCNGLTFDDGTNVLEDYVDTTSWTPTLEFGGGSTGITYTAQVGNYIRIGNAAFVQVGVGLSSKGTDTGNATIEGFPLTSGASGQNVAFATWSLLAFTVNHDQAYINIGGSSSTFNLRSAGNNVAFINLTDVNFTNDTQLLGNFWMFL